jgi:hypothetical protein
MIANMVRVLELFLDMRKRLLCILQLQAKASLIYLGRGCVA